MEHTTSEHGTPNKYQSEIRSDGVACGPCVEANRDYARSWRIRTGYTDRMKVPVELLHDLVHSTDPAESTRLLLATVGPLTGSSIMNLERT